MSTLQAAPARRDHELKAKRPPPHWDRLPPDRRLRYEHEVWGYGPLRVISEVMDMEAPDGSGDVIPQWHISISRKGERCDDHDVGRVLRAFEMEGAEEDNHHPGVARHFFLTVDPARRVACECKADEAVVVDPDGYRWSNDPKDCRGCEFQRISGRACPIHPPA